ncbi:uncharacterized protein LOC106094417 [Stomoxys calcitrans]|uniref:BED-type domain-containing protein n=1 Tax=Stomoxys calcitrans TaxID=35570 RepID=A0A1I8NXS3_STOCA|nr:uncharacterized protein LOC106094417 [Stomoxys calcitrans]
MSDNEFESRRKIRKSLVWQYFEKLSTNRMKCRICMHDQRYMGNTANALRHLKVKHDIDARACGLDDPENVRRMKELSRSSSQLEETIAAIRGNNYNSDDGPFQAVSRRPSKTQDIFNYDGETEFDPYNSDNEHVVEIGQDSKNFLRTNVQNLESSPLPKFTSSSSSKSGMKRKELSLEEERIVAETEYFREKAAYFRIQKHLALLQAKKVKHELQQLYGK